MTPDVSLPDSLRSGRGPLVSVVVPTYEDDEFLPGALESIAAQHADVELVVVDSSGVGWLRDLAARVEGVEYVYQEPSGLSAARNRGIDVARGEYVAFLDADDRWREDKLEKQLAVMRDGADVVYSDVTVVGESGRRRLSSLPVERPAAHHVDFLYSGGVPILTVLVRRACLERHRFDESLGAVEDRHLLARLFAEFRPGRVAEPLAEYAERADSMSSDAELMYRSERDSLADLVARYPDLDAHRSHLEARAAYSYGKRLLRTGDARAARRPLFDALRGGAGGYRGAALLALSLLPRGHERLLWELERLEECRR
ncbi:glycosyltransferase family 2 protein [Halomarina ordinaria]|uniref:Glycosyltransferase family 2 protein n=1 Tax=Halomarina ordinaria TaxID=3033939 RepID=A0ABD5U8G2_9EURY|nr:glycosyltransferase [Halomarina sp. PSRA2]